MFTKFIPKPQNLTFNFIPPLPPPHHHSNFIKPFSLSKTLTHTLSSTISHFTTLDHYGPSLHKGLKPQNHTLHTPQQQSEDNESCLLLDESSFTRVFDITAVRVPSEHCFALESRLRGHLLNWPRIRNIARVPGDEIEDRFKDLVTNSGSTDEEEVNSSLQRRIHGKADGDGELLSPVLYREKLVKTFNSKGYVNFRNLAKISRPKRRTRSGPSSEVDERGKGKKKGIQWNDVYMVEVVVDESDEDGDEDLSGLLGDDFVGRKWRGASRLLLLDESYAGKALDEMPEAIKAVLREDFGGSTKTAIEVVRCKLTLFYKYWQMNEILEALLPKGTIIPSSFETVGHIAHLNLKDEHLPYKKLIAKVVLDKNNMNIQTVVNKIDAIHSDYRTMQLEVLAGNHSLATMVVENGLRFHVDLGTVLEF